MIAPFLLKILSIIFMATNDDLKNKKCAGRILEARPNGQFLVELEDKKTIRAYVGGKMSQNRIKILVGDMVDLVVPLDMRIENSIGRIVYRRK